MVKNISDDIRFRVMREIEGNPEISQRELSSALGVSLGVVNYCMRALAKKGQVKVKNFRASDNKLRYAYILTPQGIIAKSNLMRSFLQRRIQEYEALKQEISEVQSEMDNSDDEEAK